MKVLPADITVARKLATPATGGDIPEGKILDGYGSSEQETW